LTAKIVFKNNNASSAEDYFDLNIKLTAALL